VKQRKSKKSKVKIKSQKSKVKSKNETSLYVVRVPGVEACNLALVPCTFRLT
jgi:hypothetical protein